MAAAQRSLDRTLQELHEAEEITCKTQTKMVEQTEQLECMARKADLVHGRLEATDSRVNKAAKAGWTPMAFGKTISVGIGHGISNRLFHRSPPVIPEDATGTLFAEGFLLKRGPVHGYRWQKRWCAMRGNMFIYYTDESCSVCKGEIKLMPNARVVPFDDPSAPFDAPLYRSKQMYGFLIDADPMQGPGRRVWYFDPEDEHKRSRWINAFKAYGKQEKKAAEKKAAVKACEESPSLDTLGQINVVLEGLHEGAIGMGEELHKQGQMIDQVNSEVDLAATKIQKQTSQIRKM
eukprot:gnl/TRDRNA2_/TRDRNA2_162700_c0_seq3.p1 gnl/TRDRNA2_/TRDRNA2_162700_c0~~gnl/TRDRNA2_/TRDRNA2_162700_c0_seq3.p1  ORF type:complete len:291 (+),score=44.93 gnl/TRDRNA2_/TRDRNA2_162700_c0_seq3:88-960(+)